MFSPAPAALPVVGIANQQLHRRHRPEAVTRILAIVTRAIETALIRRAGKTRKGGACGGIVTLTYPARFSASGVP